MVAEAAVRRWRLRDKCLGWVVTVKPPSPVGSAEQVLVIFSFMIPLLTPCMRFLKLWSIRSQNHPR